MFNFIVPVMFSKNFISHKNLLVSRFHIPHHKVQCNNNNNNNNNNAFIMHYISTQKSVLRGTLHSVYDSYICQNNYIYTLYHAHFIAHHITSHDITSSCVMVWYHVMVYHLLFCAICCGMFYHVLWNSILGIRELEL